MKSTIGILTLIVTFFVIGVICANKQYIFFRNKEFKEVRAGLR